VSRGIALHRVVTLERLQASYGGQLDTEARGARAGRLVAASDASEAEDAGEDLVLVTSSRVLPLDAEVRGIFLCTPELASELPSGRRWIHDQALWAMASVLGEVQQQLGLDQEVSTAAPNAVLVSGSARVDPSARVEAGTVVFGGATVGPDSVVGPNAVVYGRVTIGARVRIGPCSVIGQPGFGWTAGPDGTLLRVPQLGGVVIEDDVEVGALCTVDAGTLGPTRLASGVRLDAHVHVGHNVEIGQQTLVAAQVGFAGSVSVGARARIGGQAGVADHVRIGNGVSVAAKTGVIGDVNDGAVVAGFPAVAKARWLRAMAKLLRRSSAR
jgi:UDP-3-O-[3-hydroxymyristoyl] glucosamine N-acyltransferase